MTCAGWKPDGRTLAGRLFSAFRVVTAYFQLAAVAYFQQNVAAALQVCSSKKPTSMNNSQVTVFLPTL